MRLTLLATAFAVVLGGCHDVTEPTARVADAPNRHHISYTEPSVTISGPTTIYTQTSQLPSDHTLTATVTGGEAPYTYQWEFSPDGEQWDLDTYNIRNSITFAAEPVPHTLYFRVTVTDKWGHTAMDNHTVRVYVM